MVFDPGAGTTTISRKLALDAGYKLKKSLTGDVSTVIGNVTPAYTIIPNLILGGFELGPVFAHVLEFPDKLEMRTSALLGMNVLSWFKISMDCGWDTTRQKFTSAVLEFDPKFDINEPTPLNCFEPYGRQRFGSLFLVDTVSQR